MFDASDALTRPFVLALRLLWWLAWDFLIVTVTWSIGWPVWRLVTFGRYPESEFNEGEVAGTVETVLVCGLGLAILAVVGWLVAGLSGDAGPAG